VRKVNKLEELILEESRDVLRLEEMLERKSSPVLERRLSTLRRRLKEDVEEWKRDKGAGLEREIRGVSR